MKSEFYLDGKRVYIINREYRCGEEYIICKDDEGRTYYVKASALTYKFIVEV